MFYYSSLRGTVLSHTCLEKSSHKIKIVNIGQIACLSTNKLRCRTFNFVKKSAEPDLIFKLQFRSIGVSLLTELKICTSALFRISLIQTPIKERLAEYSACSISA
jgi:hypothetical protein